MNRKYFDHLEYTLPADFSFGGIDFHHAPDFKPGALSDGNGHGLKGYGMIQCGALYMADGACEAIMAAYEDHDAPGCFIQCDSINCDAIDEYPVYEDLDDFFVYETYCHDVDEMGRTHEWTETSESGVCAYIRAFDAYENYTGLAAFVVFIDEYGDEMAHAHYWF